eukprot:364935-Chlamydomonas_euryale.AAC.5
MGILRRGSLNGGEGGGRREGRGACCNFGAVAAHDHAARRPCLNGGAESFEDGRHRMAVLGSIHAVRWRRQPLCSCQLHTRETPQRRHMSLAAEVAYSIGPRISKAMHAL